MSERVPAEVFPPGEFIKDELDARGVSETDFAKAMGLDLVTVRQILCGSAEVTPELASQLETALHVDAEYWLNLEAAYRRAKGPEQHRRSRV